MGDRYEGNLDDFNSDLASEASEMEYDFPPQVRQIPNPVTPQEEVLVKSKRAGDKLSHEGHLYWFSKKSSRCDIWVCDRRKSERCPARIQTNMQKKVIRELHQHNHETNGARKFVHKVKQSLRDRAKDTVEEPSQIISTVASNLPDYVKAHLPKKHALKHIIRRQRDELVRPPPVPDSADLYVIPDRYRMYSPHPGTEEQFLLGDSGDTIPDIQRILILGRSSIRQWIHHVKKIYIDGTFKIAPFHFHQVFAIMGERGGFVLPLCYALLPDKTENSYDRMFDMVLSAFPLLEPESVSLDYEIGLINSVKKKFNNVKLGGCLFHLSKNLKEHLKKTRDEQKNCTLYKRYCDEPDFAMSARMIVSMAFLRKEDIEDALESLYEFLPEELRPILDWFEDYYIGHRIRNGRRPALFAYEMWSVYQRTLDGEGRTNNHAEAAHRRLQTELAHDHPTLWALIDGLKKAQAARDV